jgi:iron complex outermembrane receptor protein
VKPRQLLLSVARSVTVLGGCCIYPMIFSAAWAQNMPAQTADAGTGGKTELLEIVVTAEKVSQNLEKAPVAVTALTGASLEALGVKSVSDLTAVVPNFTAMQNANGSTVAIRGIVSTNQSVNGISEASYSVDGVGLVDMRDAFDGMYDVNRVEVLRGPQGTLYGANANSGAINVITNKPDLTAASAVGSIGFGNYSSIIANGALNMPISDTFGVRFAAAEEQHDGYIYLRTNDSRFDDKDFVGGRVHMLWKPSSDFSALFTYEYIHNGGAGVAGSASGAPLGLYATHQGVTPYSYNTMPGPMSLNETDQAGTLTLDWSLPFFDISNISSVRFDDWRQSDAETIFGPGASTCPNVTSTTNCYNPLINTSKDRQISEELRLSKNTELLDWLFGLYYSKYDAHLAQAYEPSNKPGLWELLDEPGYVDENKAIYGQTTWKITNKWSLVAGLRYQWDSESLPYSPAYYGPPGSIVQQQCFGCTLTNVYSGEGSWGKMTWRTGVNYDLNPRSLLYVSVATGYEQGGFSTKAEEPFNPVYGPENLTNYEIGWKSKLFDNRAQINVAAFYMDYKDYQASASLILANGSQALLTTNAGSAKIKGLELESTFLLTPDDLLVFNGTVLDAVFTDFYLPKGDGYAAVAGQVPTDYTGNQLPYAAHQTARLSYQHTFTLSEADSLIALVGTSYSSQYYTDYHNYSATSQDAYTRTDASLSWERRSAGRTFNTRIYIRNIENKAILAGGQADNSAPGRDFNQYGKNGYYLPPQTFGIQLTGSF